MTSVCIIDSDRPRDMSCSSLNTIDAIRVVSRCSSPLSHSSSSHTDEHFPKFSLDATIIPPSPSRKRSRPTPPSALSLLMDSVEKTLNEVNTLIKRKKAKTSGEQTLFVDMSTSQSTQISTEHHIALPKVDDTANGLLHLYCQKPSLSNIEMFGMIVHHFPDAIKTRTTIKKETSPSVKRSWNRQGKQYEPYTLPINIALHNNASVEIAELLASSCPEVLNLQDGRNGACSLAIALQRRCDNSIIDLLLHLNPGCVEVADKRFNFPLHVACSIGSSLRVVKSLYQLYPNALSNKNMNGETPLAIAQRNALCPEEVLDFLESNAFRER